MRSSFFEFHVAMSGMHTARNGARVTTHNMSNLTTPGFSRQVVVQRAAMPLATNNRTGMVGTGSEIIGVNQVRNIHLDARYRNEKPVLGLHHTRETQLTMVEMVFGELNNVGPTAAFEQFMAAMQDFHMYPNSPTHRNNAIQSITVKTREFNERAIALSRQQTDINREIAGMTRVINTKGEQIANLNNRIIRHEIRGDMANDLRDQRNLLIDELSQLVNITVTETTIQGTERLIIHINGQEFVHDDRVIPLGLVQRETPLHPHDAPGLYDVTIGGRPLRVDSHTFSGELRGLFEIRDGSVTRDENGVLRGDTDIQGWQGIPFRGIPYYLERLNHKAQTLANAFNFGTDRLGAQMPDLGGSAGEPRQFIGVTGPAGLPDWVLDGVAAGTLQVGPEAEVFDEDGNSFVPPQFAREISILNDAGAVIGVIGENHLIDTETGQPVPVIDPRTGEQVVPAEWVVRNGGHIGGYNPQGIRPGIPLFVPRMDTRVTPPVPWQPTGPVDPATGRPTMTDDDYWYIFNNVDIFNMSLNPAIVEDPALFATALTNHEEGGVDNRGLLLGMLGIRNHPQLFREGTLNDFLNAVMSEIAMDLRSAANFTESQTNIMEVVQNQRLQVKGVDMNEEMVSMIFFQHHFQAASRMITSIDEIYNTLINRMAV